MRRRASFVGWVEFFTIPNITRRGVGSRKRSTQPTTPDEVIE
jgi:hypothetical protein